MSLHKAECLKVCNLVALSNSRRVSTGTQALECQQVELWIRIVPYLMNNLQKTQHTEHTQYMRCMHKTHSLVHTNTDHMCWSVAPGDVMHSGGCQVMLVRLRNLLQWVLMRNTCIHTQIPTNTQTFYSRTQTSARADFVPFFVHYSPVRAFRQISGLLWDWLWYVKRRDIFISWA